MSDRQESSSLSNYFAEIHESGSLVERMHYEWLRLYSFNCYPSTDGISSLRLAASGFYYTGIGDEVKCFSCGKVYETGCFPFDERSTMHRNHFPNCDLVIGSGGGNVPIARGNGERRTEIAGCSEHFSTSENNACHDGMSSNATSEFVSNSQNATGNSDNRLLVHPSNRNSYESSCSDNPASERHPVVKEALEELGIYTERPRNPEYADYARRLESFTCFNQWPENIQQRPAELAEAGFCYTGEDDLVRCFFCGGGLKNWEPGDDPWVEHARWFPRCAFVQVCKGNNFVETTRNNVDSNRRETDIHESATGFTDTGNLRVSSEQSIAVESVIWMGYTCHTVEDVLRVILRNSTDPESVRGADILAALLTMEDLNIAFITPSVSRTPPTTCQPGPAYQNRDMTDPVVGEYGNQSLEGNIVLRIQHLCKVCLVKTIKIAFLPCGHLVCCEYCAFTVTKCVACKEIVKGLLMIRWD